MDLKGKFVYISGPIAGEPGYRARFAEAAAVLRAMGADVFDPSVLAVQFPSWLPEDFMCYDLDVLTGNTVPKGGDLRRCVDLLVSLDGWEASKGARIERIVADACGIRAVDYGKAVM